MTLYMPQRRGIARRTLLAGATSLVSFPAIRAQAQTAGVALVIGNSKYTWESSLPNVKRDTTEVARIFEALGLKTDFIQDANKDALQRAIEKVAAAARGANLAVIYFAGHGVTPGSSFNEDAYIVPADADLANPESAQSLMAVHTVIASLKEASHRLLIFDSCRNNPADGWKQRRAAEARTNAANNTISAARQPNTLVLFSTAPGRVALDGPAGDYSPFAASFLGELHGEQVDLQTLPARLRRRLLIATGGQQLLWDHGTYSNSFNLRRPGAPQASSRRPSAELNSGGAKFQFVELGNAYSYARQHDFVFPPGLVALRPRDGSPHIGKIGSYKFEVGATTPWTSQFTGWTRVPGLFAVLSVTNDIAHMVATGRFARGRPAYMRFLSERLSGNRFVSSSYSETVKNEITWDGDDRGSYSQTVDSPNIPRFDSRFERLD